MRRVQQGYHVKRDSDRCRREGNDEHPSGVEYSQGSEKSESISQDCSQFCFSGCGYFSQQQAWRRPEIISNIGYQNVHLTLLVSAFPNMKSNFANGDAGIRLLKVISNEYLLNWQKGMNSAEEKRANPYERHSCCLHHSFCSVELRISTMDPVCHFLPCISDLCMCVCLD